ncbi:metallo-beta-lactamase domain protein [Leptospira wolbachii serovar Codice str. CDC]|uniref:Metallo-beta-lactamase domain protein n=1 Tax=Leptospira wolbachii serovar Codice str. CDC TaxID=1218599 RepID=R9A0A6_9LEPT|nr:N-acyl homoserine lactonase family protein [Leptospira wolbachii]EOQ95419.1 metallo-beta-lactamase domain protein [Leptospira wolbachii serovar Codice str. CDC]
MKPLFPILVLVGLFSLFGCFGRAAVAYSKEVSPIQLQKPISGMRLEVFQTGRMVIDGWAVYTGGEGKISMDQPAYLISHPRYGLIAFEAGHHSAIATDPTEHLGWIHRMGLMPMEQDPGQDFRSQLIKLGKNPDSLRDILVSHFHPEHVGAVEEFPKARIVVDRREVKHGNESPNYNYVKNEYDGVLNWYQIDFSQTDKFGSFEGYYDLVGDGSIIILSTPGHTPGHISVLVNLESGPVLLTGDMAWTEYNIRSASIGLPFISSDGEAARRSLGQLLAFQSSNPAVLIVPGHDLNPLRRKAQKDIHIHPWVSVDKK